MQVHFIVAACENMISGTGMRPGDIVTASNGKTIEVWLSEVSHHIIDTRLAVIVVQALKCCVCFNLCL